MLRPKYPIDAGRVLLRPFVPGDLDALYDLQSRPDVTRYLYWEPRSADEVRDVIAQRAARTTLDAEGQILVLAVVLRDFGTLVGDVSLTWLSRKHAQGEIGYVMHPDHHGRGLATEAARAMLGLAFDGLGLHRVIGRCDAANAPSARLMERLGMRREAHFVENEIFKGEWSDEYVYAMLASEWKAAQPRR
jgi:RimJ/RimL family protein N-acetyltransferase